MSDGIVIGIGTLFSLDRKVLRFWYDSVANEDLNQPVGIKKWIRGASNFIALIPCRSVRQMLEHFSGVQF